MPSVSAIILTRDSQRTIKACIQAIKPAVDHVIVVDTGSTDDTVQIAKSHGAYVYHFEWRDDFSAARNFADSLATSDWVVHVDSDEILREEDAPKIRRICAQYKKSSNPVSIAILQINVYPDRTTASSVTRMYKRGTLTWGGLIHEQLSPRREGTRVLLESDIGVFHDGYNPDVINQRGKVMRNICLLEKGLENEPDNAAYHFFLGRELSFIDDYESAVPYLRKSIDLSEQQGGSFVLEDIRELLSRCLEKSSGAHISDVQYVDGVH